MKRTLADLQEYVREISTAYESRDAYRYIEGDSIVRKTYKTFGSDIFALASYLTERGWHKKHIAIIGSSSYAWVVTFLGIACSDNVVIPIDKMLSTEEMLGLLVMGDVDAVFLSDEFSPMIENIERADNRVTEIINFSSEQYQRILETKHVPLPRIDPDAMAEILFTSGTTGVSKGVMISQKSIVANIADIYRMDFGRGIKYPIVMSVLPIHHTFELTVDNLGVLYCGATVCINDKLENIVANLGKFKPAVILVVPAIAEVFYKKVMEGISTGANKRKIGFARKLNRLLGRFGVDARRVLYKSLLKKFGGNLSRVIVGGAALRSEIAQTFEEFGVSMYQGYGMTECAPLISANYPGINRHGSVGKPVNYMDVKIEDGEILTRGDGVMLGYYKNEEATREAMTEDGWLRTGDLGYFDRDGYLYITGRSKNLIILDNGKNIYPEELEAHLAVIPGIKEIMVYESRGKLCAAIQPTDINDKCLLKDIKGGIKKYNNEAPPYKRIVSYDFIARDFPKTTSLKIKRKEAIKMVSELVCKKTVENVPPTTPEQIKIVAAFEKILGCKNVGIKDDFFDLGGDSLAALEVGALIGVPAQELYDHPTAEQLEQVLMAVKDKESSEQSKIDINELIRHNSNQLHDAEIKYVMLTGATGYLGSHILHELMRRKMSVICLVRNEQKLKDTLKYYFPREHEYFAYKVILGDIAEPMLGLDEQNYQALAKKVDMVIHTAANVSHAGNYADFERTNVQGTQNVIDFCRLAGAVLQHTSTASVHGAGTVAQNNPDAKFDEFSLDIGQEYSQNVYIHSKYKAEEAVLLAREEGLEANIFRIGNLTWRMKDGVFQKNAQDNGFIGRYKGLMKVGVYSKEIAEYPIDFTPVDECADAYVRLSLSNRVNNIYNLYNPHLFTISTLAKKTFRSIKQVRSEIFEKSLKELITDKEVAVLSFYSAIASSSANVPISNEYTVAELGKLGFKWSKINLRYLSYMKKIK
ncbi:MAG: AMP-binding protein [Clostridia bacterium]|nr:AMP-binding protein [Clostridia bacterium]